MVGLVFVRLGRRDIYLCTDSLLIRPYAVDGLLNDVSFRLEIYYCAKHHEALNDKLLSMQVLHASSAGDCSVWKGAL